MSNDDPPTRKRKRQIGHYCAYFDPFYANVGKMQIFLKTQTLSSNHYPETFYHENLSQEFREN